MPTATKPKPDTLTAEIARLAALHDQARTELNALTAEQASAPARLSEAIHNADGATAVAIRRRADDLPVLIQCATVAAMRSNLELDRASLPVGADEEATAQAAWDQAKAAYDAAVNGTLTGETRRGNPVRVVDPVRIAHLQVDLDAAADKVRVAPAPRKARDARIRDLERSLARYLADLDAPSRLAPVVRSRIHAPNVSA